VVHVRSSTGNSSLLLYTLFIHEASCSGVERKARGAPGENGLGDSEEIDLSLGESLE
jgi:hypothetical protein